MSKKIQLSSQNQNHKGKIWLSLDIFPKTSKLVLPSNTWTPIFVSVLLTIAKIWTKITHPSTKEWTSKTVLCSQELYPDVKYKDLPFQGKMHGTGYYYVKWNKQITKKTLILSNVQNTPLNNIYWAWCRGYVHKKYST